MNGSGTTYLKTLLDAWPGVSKAVFGFLLISAAIGECVGGRVEIATRFSLAVYVVGSFVVIAGQLGIVLIVMLAGIFRGRF